MPQQVETGEGLRAWKAPRVKNQQQQQFVFVLQTNQGKSQHLHFPCIPLQEALVVAVKMKITHPPSVTSFPSSQSFLTASAWSIPV